MGHKTDQEAFWAGKFGDEYIERNFDANAVASNLALLTRITGGTRGVSSIIEYGANVGVNLRGLRCLLPGAELEAVEINPNAAAALRAWGGCAVRETSILEYQTQRQFDLSFTKGVLIHIDPNWLPRVYDLLYSSSRRYIMMAEYYNPTPVEVAYRGHTGKLFKRDFAGEFLDRFPDVALLDYGFVYRRDPNFPQDDFTWFLMEKQTQSDRPPHLGNPEPLR